MSSQHIGAAGELLVQYQFLKHYIDSARLTTDSGLDLVAYAPKRSRAYTIQVKTQQQATPAGGGNGKPSIGWTFNPDCGADFMAFAELSTNTVWLFPMSDAVRLAQQKRPGGHRLYWYVDPDQAPKTSTRLLQADLDDFLLENQVNQFFE